MAVAHPFGTFVRCRFKRIGCVRRINVKITTQSMHLTGILLHFELSSCPTLASEGCHFMWTMCTEKLHHTFLVPNTLQSISTYD